MCCKNDGVMQGGIDSRSLAILGVLTAVVAAVRPLGGHVAGLEPVWAIIIIGGRALGASFGFVLGTIRNKSIDALSELLLNAESFCNKKGHKKATKPINEVTIIDKLVNELTLINFKLNPLGQKQHLTR